MGGAGEKLFSFIQRGKLSLLSLSYSYGDSWTGSNGGEEFPLVPTDRMCEPSRAAYT